MPPKPRKPRQPTKYYRCACVGCQIPGFPNGMWVSEGQRRRHMLRAVNEEGRALRKKRDAAILEIAEMNRLRAAEREERNAMLLLSTLDKQWLGINSLIIVRATQEQYAVTLARQYLEWGVGCATLEQYITREKELTSMAFASKNMTAWVLVPPSDPTSLNFFASCESYRRPVFMSCPTSPAAQEVVGYSVAGVFTPPHLRGLGFARKMLELLHLQFAIPLQEVPLQSTSKEKESEGVGTESQGGQDAILSFLFSDVGDFYGRIGNGWHVLSSESTVWNVANLGEHTFVAPEEVYGPSLNLITTEDQLEALALQDATRILASLSKSASTDSISIAVKPSVENYLWAVKRSAYYAEINNRLLPVKWGLAIPPSSSTSYDSSFILFLPDYPASSLKIIRFHSTSISHTRLLLRAALLAARAYGVEKMEVWNLGKENPEWNITELDEIERGETKPRMDSLSSLSWYGPGGNGGREVNWRWNECFAWC